MPSALDDDGKNVAVLQLVVKPYPLVVKLGAWSSDSSEAEFPYKVTMQFDANVLYGRIVLDNQRLLHVGFLSLGFEINPHETEVVVDEILEFVQTDVLEGGDVHDGPSLW